MRLKNILTIHVFTASSVKTWPTKSYEVWLLIQFLLLKEKPNKVVEFGSGRSTHYFAEYNQKFNKEFFSIEQNPIYILRNWLGLKLSYIDQVKFLYVSIKGDWFDIKKLKKNKHIKNADLLFLDAPGGTINMLNKGSRKSKLGLTFLLDFFPNCKNIIIDDLQSKELISFCKEFLKARKELHYFLISYNEKNLILFCININIKEDYLKFMEITNIKRFLLYETNNFSSLEKYIKLNNLFYDGPFIGKYNTLNLFN